MKLLLISLLIVITTTTLSAQNTKLHLIPSQTVDVWPILGDENKNQEVEAIDFEISEQITLKEYKEYLLDMKKDSTEGYYLSLLPDSGICDEKEYIKYMSDSQYDNYPIVGISWYNVLNFCKWKTLKENNTDSLRFIYRLPLSSEWLIAYNYLNKMNIKNTFNKDYSDWLLSSNDESYNNFHQDKIPLDVLNLDTKDYLPAMQRKKVIGNSFLFQKDMLFNHWFYYYYAYAGYRHISFRIVKDYFENNDNLTVISSVMDYWKLYENKLEQKKTQRINNAYFNVSYGLKDGKFHGFYTSHYPNGLKKAEGKFENNSRKGMWTVWDSIGNVRMQRFYKNSFEYEQIYPEMPKDGPANIMNNPAYKLKRTKEGYIEDFLVDERMVSFAQRIWRTIPVNSNKAAFDKNTYTILYNNQLINNKIIAYDPIDEDFTKKLNNEEIKTKYSPDNVEIVDYKILEDWFFDNERFISEKRIIGICPIAKIKGQNEKKDLFWLYYPHIRKVLASKKIIDNNFPDYIKNVEDVFFFRDFSSYITKEENVYDKSIPEKDIKKETERIELDLIETEHDLWLSFFK